MSRTRAVTMIFLTAALTATAAIGVAVPANAQEPTGPNDPKCIQQPDNPICAGGPYAPPAPPAPPPPAPPSPPTGPLDPACMSNPADAACVGSPYLPPPPPPPAPPVAPPPMAPAGAPFDTFTLGPHIDDMMPIDDTAAAMPAGTGGAGHI